MEEKLSILGELVIHENIKNAQLIDNLSALKRVTREELFKRLLVAKEYLFANFERRITLEELSKISFLLVNHLTRHFNQLFGVTPHQYLTQVRIDKSKHLLANTELSLAKIVSLMVSHAFLLFTHCFINWNEYAQLNVQAAFAPENVIFNICFLRLITSECCLCCILLDINRVLYSLVYFRCTRKNRILINRNRLRR